MSAYNGIVGVSYNFTDSVDGYIHHVDMYAIVIVITVIGIGIGVVWLYVVGVDWPMLLLVDS